jgi:hypothetical protein
MMSASVSANGSASGGVGATTSVPTTNVTVVPTPAEQRSAFHQFLSELNPLQYIPVIGTIYRAVTGDTIPDTARFAGSLVVSGLTGGPIGVAMTIGMTAVEKVTGIDPEAIGQDLLADVGIGTHKAASHPKAAVKAQAAAPAAQPVAAPALALQAGAPAIARHGWSQAQLAAYGVTKAADGTLTLGALRGSDVLNALELARAKAGRLA